MLQPTPAPPAASAESIRKSAFGRTNLFLRTKGGLFREVKCASSVTRHAGASVFHPHHSCSLHKDVCTHCWHCCTQFETPGIRLPRLYDSFERVYHVYGWFCSPACAKAYIIEHTTFDRGQQMNVFSQMLQEVYGISNSSVTEAPPRMALKMFGGPFDIETFRKQSNVCTLVSPPFVSYCMLIEERQPIASIGEGLSDVSQRNTVKGLRRPQTGSVVLSEQDHICSPQNESLYHQFLAEQNEPTEREPAASAEGSAPSPEPAKRQRKERKVVPTGTGGLARFAK